MRSALQHALDALEDIRGDNFGFNESEYPMQVAAIAALKQALSEPEVSPEQHHYMNGFAEGVKRAKAEASSKRDTGKAYEQGRRDMLDEVLRIAPGSVAVLLERLKEAK